jgi:charged multivesicular body protein 7
MNEAAPVIDEDEIDDELEAMEQSSREANEEIEAEKTRKKLAELDNLKEASGEVSRQRQADKDTEAQLTNRLSNLSVEERPMEAK